MGTFYPGDRPRLPACWDLRTGWAGRTLVVFSCALFLGVAARLIPVLVGFAIAGVEAVVVGVVTTLWTRREIQRLEARIARDQEHLLQRHFPR